MKRNNLSLCTFKGTFNVKGTIYNVSFDPHLIGRRVNSNNLMIFVIV